MGKTQKEQHINPCIPRAMAILVGVAVGSLTSGPPDLDSAKFNSLEHSSITAPSVENKLTKLLTKEIKCSPL